jgi:hypothetical protein
MDKSKLLSQVFSTYNWLRFGLVFIGVAFPILLWREVSGAHHPEGRDEGRRDKGAGALASTPEERA